jgi:hypothetical protein
MELGAFSVSLNVADLGASRRFYEALGFTPFHGDASQGWEPGSVALPADDWRRFRDAVAHA